MNLAALGGADLVSLIETATESAVQRSLLTTIVPVYRHGVVTDVDLDTYIHSVQMDGDSGSIPVHDITQLGPPLGEKVTVLFAPPHQAMIIGQPVHDTWHFIGATGEPAFATGWANSTASGPIDTAEYPEMSYRRFGHLCEMRGQVLKSAGTSLITTIPEWYRPRNNLTFACIGPLGGHGVLQINRDGQTLGPVLGNGTEMGFQVMWTVA